MHLSCSSKVFRWSKDKASWHFVAIPKEQSLRIQAYTPFRRGFGAVKVRVTLGQEIWETSLFPDAHSGCYLLPIKATVRKKEAIYDGDSIEFSLHLI